MAADDGARAVLEAEGYDWVEEIGSGATGKAVLVESNDGDRCVVKIMNLSQLNAKEQQNAANEVKVMQQLNHPYIVRYIDSFQNGNFLYIVMEYAPGGDIQSQLDAAQRAGHYVDEEQLMTWFCQLALALKHCHGKRILHRDLKPENIFLGADRQVKLGDFGLGKCLNDSLEMAKTTAGTPFYLSPEICNGKTYNRKSDIWALGCCLYKMATFTHAFQTNTLPDLVAKIRKGAYDPIPRMYSTDMRALISFLLTSDPKARPSIDEVILDCPFLACRVESLLSKEMIEAEFGPANSATLLSDPTSAFDMDKAKGKSKSSKKTSKTSKKSAKKLRRKSTSSSSSSSSTDDTYSSSSSSSSSYSS